MAELQYLCRDCPPRNRGSPRRNAYSEQESDTILRACDMRSSLRGLSRTFGVSRNTVISWLNEGSGSAGTG